MILALLAVLLHQSAPVPEDLIVVEGERAPAEELSTALGSRIPRVQSDFGNGQIATTTGVRGLTPGSGMDPFGGETRRKTVHECRSDPQVSKELACLFVEAQTVFESGEYDAARSGVERILEQENLTREERYFAHRIAFELARADGGDARDRREALEGMLASGLLAEEDRGPALRTAAALALAEGEKDLAVKYLEAAIMAAPDHARSRGNLAALYAETGRDADALKTIREAIALADSSGDPVPPEWLAFSQGR